MNYDIKQHALNTNISSLSGDYGDIPENIKRSVINLMEHECNQSKSDEFKSTNNLDPYINQLLHQISKNKKKIIINWNALHTDILKKYNDRGVGYIGYSFVKSYFINSCGDAINLDFINILFPSTATIWIVDLAYIDSGFLEKVIEFLQSKQNKKIWYFEMEIQKKYGKSNIDLQCKKYKHQFNKIGYNFFTGYQCEEYTLLAIKFGF